MTAQRMDGKLVAEAVKAAVKDDVAAFKAKTGVTPGLATLLVGSDPASQVYVRNKVKSCEAAGMKSFHQDVDPSISEAHLLNLVQTLNDDANVHGILVQLPLPKHIRSERILEAILPAKDVDGFHPVNMGRLVAGQPSLKPCTPFGVMKLLEFYKIPIAGKDAVVVGRSNIVGKPMALMLLAANATVTVAHSKTQDLSGLVGRADIVVAAVGIPGFVKGAWIKPGATVIDVGINRLADGKLCGDVEYAAAAERAAFITPVPGGVGLMTIAMLLQNTLQAAQGNII
jgi:methylenetetrahydrofolate dehydrogenase (NADP+)/methenyltetrahydrofolate cyclohydrolase